jgi:elongation factor Ts
MLELIQKIREQTGAGIMDIKRALVEAGNDETKTLELLRKRGQKIAAKKQEERTTKEGLVDAYIHAGGSVGTLLVLACETDFVARNQDFKNLAHDLNMQIAAMNPTYVSANEIPQAVIDKETEIYREQLAKEGKPANVMEKIIAGKLNKFYEENCLLNQKFIKDDTKTINDLIIELTAKLGEKIEVKKFVRFALA